MAFYRTSRLVINISVALILPPPSPPRLPCLDLTSPLPSPPSFCMGESATVSPPQRPATFRPLCHISAAVVTPPLSFALPEAHSLPLSFFLGSPPPPPLTPSLAQRVREAAKSDAALSCIPWIFIYWLCSSQGLGHGPAWMRPQTLGNPVFFPH